MKTTGECRYRQAIPKGSGGLLDIDSNYGFRKQFLPQVINMESFVEIDTSSRFKKQTLAILSNITRFLGQTSKNIRTY